MADLSKIATETMELIDRLDEDIEEGDTVEDVVLIVAVRNDSGGRYLQYRCSHESYVVQRGLVAWANDAMQMDAIRLPSTEGDD